MELLNEKGYEVVKRNYSCRHGELDIVAKKDDTLVIVEVKTRKNGSKVSPVEAVGYKKIVKIIKSTDHMLLNEPELDNNFVQFDVVAITLENGNILDVHHYEDAFSSIDYV